MGNCNIIKATVKQGQSLKSAIAERGPQGPRGNAATVSIGNVITLPAGSGATVTNSGTINDAILDFGIPAGIQGSQGNPGKDADIVAVSASVDNTAGTPSVIATLGGEPTERTIDFAFSNLKGETGATGNGIQSIEKTSSSGNVDTYTISYTNGSTDTFTVTNGSTEWGTLTGELSNQTDLQNILNTKADTSALSVYQTATDNTLNTENKTIAGAINELNNELESKADTADLSAYLTTTSAADTYLTISSASDTYATKTELNTKANTADIPTKVSDLTNDAGYISSIPSEYITETELSTELSPYAKSSDVVEKSGDTMTGALTINKSGTSLTTSGAASIGANLTVGGTSYLQSNVYIGDSDTYFAGGMSIMSKGVSDSDVHGSKIDLDSSGAARVGHFQGNSYLTSPDSYILLDAENLKYVTSGTNGSISSLNTYNIMTSQNSYTKTEVDSLIASAGSGGSVDLTNYVTKTDFEELEDTVGDIGTLLDTINGEAV